MIIYGLKKVKMTIVLCCTLILLPGCYTASRLESLGDRPPLTPIKDPTKIKSYHPVTMPMPEPKVHEHRINSLWQDGAKGFFKDQRAKNVGDILTVKVDITNDQVEFFSETERKRENKETSGVTNLFGYEQYAKKVFPAAVNPSSLVNFSSKPEYKGNGKTKRTEKMTFKIAVTIVQILPNGNYIVSGRQEIRANFENREIFIRGIVRPSDISSTNTISHEKIAEARISYGGRGNIMDYQQPPIGSQVLTHVMPF